MDVSSTVDDSGERAEKKGKSLMVCRFRRSVLCTQPSKVSYEKVLQNKLHTQKAVVKKCNKNQCSPLQ